MNIIGKTIGISLCALLSASCWGYRLYYYSGPSSIYKGPWDREPIGQFSLDVDQDYLKVRFDLNEGMVTRFDFTSMMVSGKYIFSGNCETGLETNECLPYKELRGTDFYESQFPGFYFKGNFFKTHKETLTLEAGLNELKFPLFGDGWRLMLDSFFAAHFMSKNQKIGDTFLSEDFYWSNWKDNSSLGHFIYVYEGEKIPYPSYSEK